MPGGKRRNRGKPCRGPCIVKGLLTGIRPLTGGLQTVGIGGIAATAAFCIARWIG